jgi:hypothetical protein
MSWRNCCSCAWALLAPLLELLPEPLLVLPALAALVVVAAVRRELMLELMLVVMAVFPEGWFAYRFSLSRATMPNGAVFLKNSLVWGEACF